MTDENTILGVTKSGELLIASDGSLYQFEIVSEEMIEEYQRWDREGQTGAIDCWREAVRADHTRDSFEDWLEDVMRYDESLYFGRDDSWQWRVEEAFEALSESDQEKIIQALNEHSNSDFADAQEILDNFVTDMHGCCGYNFYEESEMACIINREAFEKYGKKEVA